jgi:hypothetical protein
MLLERDTSISIISFTFFSLPEMARITYHFLEPSAMA